MKSYGAAASDEDWKAITEYIIARLAHANVNKVTAEARQSRAASRRLTI